MKEGRQYAFRLLLIQHQEVILVWAVVICGFTAGIFLALVFVDALMHQRSRAISVGNVGLHAVIQHSTILRSFVWVARCGRHLSVAATCMRVKECIFQEMKHGDPIKQTDDVAMHARYLLIRLAQPASRNPLHFP